jgi:hypothetical protein
VVLSPRRPALARALIVPDEQTWTMSGADPAGEGLRPVFALGHADRLLVPEVLPVPLNEALRSRLAELSGGVEVGTRRLPGLEGQPVAPVLARAEVGAAGGPGNASGGGDTHGAAARHEHNPTSEHPSEESPDMAHAAEQGQPEAHVGHGGDEGDQQHSGHDVSSKGGGHDHDRDGHEMHDADQGMHGGGHNMQGDHGDMMAIVGEPSADGLVMESIELRYGPLGTPLPGGLAVDVTLDGDVVAESTVQALLSTGVSAPGTPSVPDLLTPVAWTLAIEAGAEGQVRASPWRGVAALEAERAVSHLVWLRALGRLLGWRLLVERCTLAIDGMLTLAHDLARRDEDRSERASSELSALERASARAHGVAALVRRSRVLRLRTAGLGPVTSEHAQRVGLRGPVARASGLADDGRAGEAVYDPLGFEPVVRSGGDAYARTLVRAEEAQESLRLAGAALRAEADGTSTSAPFLAPGKAVEGPRGPIHAEQHADGWRLAAPGTDEVLRTAGEAMVGAEWSAALVALASFDLSPWRVGA